ncbi:hypothetical protein M3J09_011487 [Ascochyta lentis]
MSDSNASDMLNDNGNICTVCGTPTTIKCSGCKTHFYCGKDCQTKDWPAHKTSCKDFQLERRLARVAEIVHEAYLTFRENTFDGVIEKIEDGEDVLVIHDGNPWNNEQYFTKFPHKLVSSSRRAKLGVLTAWTCDEPYGFLNMLIVKLLEGLNVDMQEIGVEFSRIPRKTVALTFPMGKPLSNWPAYQHTLLRLTSCRSGKQWIMDFAGGQYGIAQPFHTWEQYEIAFVDKLVSVYDIGTAKRVFSELAKIAGRYILVYGLVGRAAAKLEEAIDTWETENKPLLTFRGLQDAEFEQQKSSLLGALDNAVRTFIRTTDFAPVVRKAQMSNPAFADAMFNTKSKQLYDEANLLLRNVSDKHSQQLGPVYSYDSSDKHSLEEFAKMASSRGLHPLVVDGSGGKSTKIHHIIVGDL